MRLDAGILGPVSKEIEQSPKLFFQEHPPSTDNDDTMSQTKVVITNAYNENYSKKVKRLPTEIIHYNSVFDWLVNDGYPNEDAVYIERSLWFDPDLLYKADPVEGAVEFSYRMHQYGIKMPVISARTDLEDVKPKVFKNVRESTVAWYDKWMPWVSPDDIHIQARNEFQAYIYKSWMINTLGVGIHFEDSTFHTDAILTYTKAKVCLLSNQVLATQPGHPNLIQINGKNGELPNMTPVYGMFMGKSECVAQY